MHDSMGRIVPDDWDCAVPLDRAQGDSEIAYLSSVRLKPNVHASFVENERPLPSGHVAL